MSLVELPEMACATHGVSVNEIWAASRRHKAISARRDFSQTAVNVIGYAGADVARYLGITSSCVIRITSQEGEIRALADSL